MYALHTLDKMTSTLFKLHQGQCNFHQHTHKICWVSLEQPITKCELGNQNLLFRVHAYSWILLQFSSPFLDHSNFTDLNHIWLPPYLGTTYFKCLIILCFLCYVVKCSTCDQVIMIYLCTHTFNNFHILIFRRAWSPSKVPRLLQNLAPNQHIRH